VPPEQTPASRGDNMIARSLHGQLDKTVLSAGAVRAISYTSSIPHRIWNDSKRHVQTRWIVPTRDGLEVP
jgi:hypothetical protein